jgi:uncharacterized repeat protein (TIGR04076 family)
VGNPYEGIMFPAKGTVVTASGPGCRVGHAEGQTWLLKGVPPGICSFAFNAMFPAYWTLRFGGSDPSEANPDQMHVTCSAVGCGAQFRIERVSDEEAAHLREAASLITLDDLARTIPSGLSRQVR